MKTIPRLVFLLFLLSGCKGETGPAGPSLKGILSGNVVLTDSSGSRTSDYAGVTVSIEGTSYSVTTNLQGAWTINDLSTGTYTINYTKQGYDSHKDIGFQFVGGGTARTYLVYLHLLPTFTIQNISVGSSVSDKAIIVSGNVNSIKAQNVLLFLGKSIPVTSSPSNYIYYSFTYSTYSGSANTFIDYIYSSVLSSYGVSPGDKVYIVAYPASNGGWNSYTDPATGRDVITSIGPVPSRVDSILVP